MKNKAVKSPKYGIGILVLGVGAGLSMVVVGEITKKTQLVKDTLVPNGWIIAYVAAITGLWTLIASINANKLNLKISKRNHVLATVALVAIFYVIGGFAHGITIFMAWLMMLTILISITLFIWSLDKIVGEATWAGAIAGALASFVMMTFIYAIIPHEWITFANSYLGFTKDVKVSAGGQFVLNTWLDGNFWTKRTRLLPLEVNFEMLQDQATMAIYVIGAVLNIKLFVAWQKRNEVVKADEEKDKESVISKFSRFGRPVKKIKGAKA
ncbi:MAG: hypothetical protein U0R17_03880 [Acidimicrobiia bacterium]